MNVSKLVKDLNLKSMLILVTYCAFLVLCLIYFKTIINILVQFISIMQPFFIGFALAFIFNIPMKYFIRKLPIQNEKIKNKVSVILSIVLIISVVVIVVLVILPQVIQNIKLLISNFPETLVKAQHWLDQFMEQGFISADIAKKIEDFQVSFGQNLLAKVTSWAPSIALGVTHITSSVVSFFMAFVMAVYMLLSKDTLMRQIKKCGHAFLNDEQFYRVQEVLRLTGHTFENFLAGQLLEACILGVLCYIGCIFLDIPYASIAGLVIGITNIIPYFGPIIGAFIACALILFVSPIKAIIFLIFSTILQQLESNLIYPHVVGGSIGLSALWVLFAVSVGGGLFGIPGMILGLPTFSVIYELIKRLVNKRLKQKRKSEK